MNDELNEWWVIDWFGQANYQAMQWTNEWWWPILIFLFFLGSLISMSPLLTHHDHSFTQIIAVWIRRSILITSFVLFCMPFIMLYIYDMTMKNELGDATNSFLTWFWKLTVRYWHWVPIAIISGWVSRFFFNRYFLTFLSSIYRKLRKNQTDDKPSNILDESKKYKPKQFIPRKYYSKKGLTVGIDDKKKPIIIPWDIWKENMMQVIGPTGFGKGVILGCIADQVIENDQAMFSINPKKDKFLPYIMYNAAKRKGRKFYYVSLRDGELGSWGPFLGGNEEDAFTRLMMAFKLELTGEPKTDFYKRQEIKLLRRAFKKTRRVDGLYNEICGEGAETAEAELEVWKDFKTLCPPSKKGFSIAKAIEENAVVYVQGSLDHPIIKPATKIFIAELMQECRRLWDEDLKKSHMVIAIDETSFLISKVVKEALATIRSYGVTIINAYQAPDDLLNIDDDNVDGKSLKQSMNINSQIKAIYGGADYELAEWAALMSGTITKEVTKMEKTDVKAGGAETWEDNRTIGTIEENLIHPNVLLSLPKGVCIFKQPYDLPKILFTSFVPVKDKKSFNDFVNKKPHTNITKNTTIENTNEVNIEDDNADNFEDLSKDNGKELTKENPKNSSFSQAKTKKEEHQNNRDKSENTPKPTSKSETKKSDDKDSTNTSKNRKRRQNQKQKKKEITELKKDTSNQKSNSEDSGLEGFLDNAAKHNDEDLLKNLSNDEE